MHILEDFIFRKISNFYYNIRTRTHRKNNSNSSRPHFKCSHILILENWAQIPQITCKSNPKQSLQLLILHQKRLYSSFNGLCGLIYTCFLGTRVLGHTKRMNEFYLLWQSHLRVELYLSYGYLSIRTIWQNRVKIPPNHMKCHIESNPVIGTRYSKP